VTQKKTRHWCDIWDVHSHDESLIRFSQPKNMQRGDVSHQTASLSYVVSNMLTRVRETRHTWAATDPKFLWNPVGRWRLASVPSTRHPKHREIPSHCLPPRFFLSSPNTDPPHPIPLLRSASSGLLWRPCAWWRRSSGSPALTFTLGLFPVRWWRR
jgi:hypothetical protein